MTAWVGQVSSDAQLHRMKVEDIEGNTEDLIAELWQSPETAQTMNSVIRWFVEKIDATFAVEEEQS